MKDNQELLLEGIFAMLEEVLQKLNTQAEDKDIAAHSQPITVEELNEFAEKLYWDNRNNMWFLQEEIQKAKDLLKLLFTELNEKQYEKVDRLIEVLERRIMGN